MSNAIEVMPSAGRLTTSLRDIGYEFVTAVADLVDNSVTAGARQVDVSIEFDGANSRVVVADDGCGMSPSRLNEAMRFGSRRNYGADDLGKFGLGLKTASLSQCRRIIVATRAALERRRLHVRVLDLDHIATTDRWEVLAVPPSALRPSYLEPLAQGTGTVVVWERLDRVLPYANPDGEWARRRLAQLAGATHEYLAMVFHQFIGAELEGYAPLKIAVNGEVVQPWDPFGRSEPHHLALGERRYTLACGDITSEVVVRPYVLPPRDAFSSPHAFERLAGPQKWNRQQGLYVYRAGRLIQSGGWCGLRTLDEHTKLARVALSFGPELDELFQVNVAKMRVGLPPELKGQVQKTISDVCTQAELIYREAAAAQAGKPDQHRSGIGAAADVGLALRAAAMTLGDVEWNALERIIEQLRRTSPELAESLGL